LGIASKSLPEHIATVLDRCKIKTQKPLSIYGRGGRTITRDKDWNRQIATSSIYKYDILQDIAKNNKVKVLHLDDSPIEVGSLYNKYKGGVTYKPEEEEAAMLLQIQSCKLRDPNIMGLVVDKGELFAKGGIFSRRARLCAELMGPMVTLACSSAEDLAESPEELAEVKTQYDAMNSVVDEYMDTGQYNADMASAIPVAKTKVKTEKGAVGGNGSDGEAVLGYLPQRLRPHTYINVPMKGGKPQFDDEEEEEPQPQHTFSATEGGLRSQLKSSILCAPQKSTSAAKTKVEAEKDRKKGLAI